ncbi:MAG: diguanylate cyclase [Sulfuricellaceae bacterium]
MRAQDRLIAFFKEHSGAIIIFFGFGIVVALMGWLTTASLSRLNGIRANIEDIVVQHNEHAGHVRKMYQTTRDRSVLLQKIITEPDPFARDELAVRVDELGSEFAQLRSAFMNLAQPAEKEFLERQGAASAKTKPLQYKVIELAMQGNISEAQRVLVQDALPAQDAALAALNDLLAYQDKQIMKFAGTAYQREKEAYTFLLLGGSGSILLSILIAFFVRTQIKNLIARLLATSKELEENARELKYQKIALDEHAIVSICDSAGIITYANEKFSQVSQYTQAELLGQDFWLTSSCFYTPEFFEEMWRTIAGGTTWCDQVKNRRKDGSCYWEKTTIVPFLDEQGNPYQYVSVRTDITPIKEAEEVLNRSKDELERMVLDQTTELREREEVLRSITGAAQDAIIINGAAGNITYWNRAAQLILGYPEEEALGQNLHELIAPDRFKKQYEELFTQFTHTGSEHTGKTTELTAQRRDGKEIPVEVSLSAVSVHGQWNAIGILRDISERKGAEAALQKLATTDPLTGIANRRKFNETLEMEIERSERHGIPLALILMDIDHFKNVNDTYGHPTGDSVLAEFARIIESNIRINDEFARWGGEEFILLSPHIEAEKVLQFGNKLRKEVEKFQFTDVGKVTCSLGATSFHPGETIQELVARVDSALYMAKQNGRNRVEQL